MMTVFVLNYTNGTCHRITLNSIQEKEMEESEDYSIYVEELLINTYKLPLHDCYYMITDNFEIIDEKEN